MWIEIRRGVQVNTGNSTMKVAFYGGQVAGMFVLTGLLAHQNISVSFVIAQDDIVKQTAQLFHLKLMSLRQLDSPKFIEKLKKSIDVLICCHGRKILQKELTDSIRCINFHPCLYKYKGAYPIKRLLSNKDQKASIGAHIMTERIDRGPRIAEIFTSIDHQKIQSECEAYNQLYPVYLKLLDVVLKKIK